MDYEKLVKWRNASSTFATHVGVVATEIGDGYAVTEVTLGPEHGNTIGNIQGGCYYTLADVAAGAACASFGYYNVTVSGEYHYLHAANHNKTKKLLAKATCIKRSKTIPVFDVEVTTEEGELVGKGTFTNYILTDRPIDLDGID